MSANENARFPKFPLGQTCLTAGVNDLATEEGLAFLSSIQVLFYRHMCGDWGDVCDEDKQMNNEALIGGGRLLSSYELTDSSERKHTVWIITEADRSVTTMLFPSEY